MPKSDDVLRGNAGDRIGGRSRDGAAVVNESFELDDLGDEVQIDGISVRANDWFHFESDASIARFECGGSGWSHGE